MRDKWNKLGKRDRVLLSAGMALLVGLSLVEVALLPLMDAKEKLTRSIQNSERILKEMTALGSEYRILRKGMEDIRKGISRRSQDFTLFSYLEKRAGDAGIRSNVKHMHPSRGPVSGSFEESCVEVKLEKVTLKQLVTFLSAVESPADVVRVKRLSVKKGSGNPEYLAALIQVVTYQPSKPGNRQAR